MSIDLNVALRLLDEATMCAEDSPNGAVRVVRRDEAEAIIRNALQGAAPEAGDTEAILMCLEDALRPFASQADSMQVLKDSDKVCGINVAHFRYAARVLREADERKSQLERP